MSLKNLFVSFCVTSALTLSVAGTARAADDEKCALETKLKDSPTAQACAKGGRKEAARKMKEMVKAAKAKGVKFVCDDCHKDNETYKLTDNAEKDYEKLLAAQK